jgi:DNA-binding transcriptional MerR regulator
MTPATWTISELAHEFDVTPRTIRFYEDQGIVSPARDGRKRVYGPRDRTRLKLALRGKRLGLALADIRGLIDMYESPRDTQAQLRSYEQVLARHRDTLLGQRRDIDETLAEIETQQGQCHALLHAAGATELDTGKPSN